MPASFDVLGRFIASGDRVVLRMNGVELFAWLEAALEVIAAGHPNDRLDDLLPRALKPAST